MMSLQRLAALALAALPTLACAAPEDAETSSPWLITPTFSSAPKLGTSAGLLAGYLHAFDEKSPTSFFGLNGTYSDTDSRIFGAFARAYWGEDHHRLMAVMANGLIRNDYEDFLGSGHPLASNDDLNVYAVRYLYRFSGNWFAGFQAVANDYSVYADDPLQQSLLTTIGLVGTRSIGGGLVIEHDTREQQNSPRAGHWLKIAQMANRPWMGSDAKYDTLRVEYSAFRAHGGNSVLAINAIGRWTQDAPASVNSSLNLPSYVRGQYLGKHDTEVQVEDRIGLADRYGAVVFAGVGCLYESLGDCNDSDHLYPAGGFGAFYIIKPEERMVVRFDAAWGKDSNEGYYLKFGHPF